MRKIIDISPPISTATAVWPGDAPFQTQVKASLAKGDTVDLTCISSSLHIGAHADAPSHYHRQGVPIDEVDLDAYVGPCWVVDVPTAGAIQARDCAAAVGAGAKRVLFRTGSFPDHQVFNRDFAYFAPEALAFMGQAGVVLVGIDTPSVDPFDSKDMAAHGQLYKYGIRNLEGLDLLAVSPGPYELVALPLRFVGLDGSPVRAILRPL